MRGGAPLAFALMVVLIVALQFGPALGLLGFRLTGSTSWSLIGGARDALVVVMVLLAAAALLASSTPARLPGSAAWALLLVLVYCGFAIASTQPAVLVALNLRRLALVPLLFIALLVLPWSRAQLESMMHWLLATSAAVTLIGLLERFAPDALWTTLLDVGSFMASNPLDPFGLLPFESSGRFFSWDLEPGLGIVLRRLVSTYLEPTTLAPTLALAMLAAWAARARRHFGRPLLGAPVWVARTPVPALLFLVAGVLTVSKGFVVFLVLLLLWRCFGVPQPRQVFLLSVLGIAGALAAAEAGFTEGAFSHLAGLASAARHIADGHLLGEGLGAAGNYGFADTDLGAESGLGNGIAQVGVAALLPLLWVRAIAIEAWQTAQRRLDPGGPWLAAWLLFWFLTYLLSASSLGVGGNALGFAALALYLHPAWDQPDGPA